MRTLIASLFVALCSIAQAGNFDPSTGTGSYSIQEVQALYQTSVDPKSITFAARRTDQYTATVTYTNSLGKVVTEQQTRYAFVSFGVGRSYQAGTFTLTGFTGSNQMSLPPVVGEKYGNGSVTAVSFVSSSWVAWAGGPLGSQRVY